MIVMIKVNYNVLLELKYPRTSYVLTNLCEGVNIEDTFFEAVERFNTHLIRNEDGLNISYKSIVISNNLISFKLSAYPKSINSLKHIGNIVGSGLSKRLFHNHNWHKLSLKGFTSDSPALFDVSVTPIILHHI